MRSFSFIPNPAAGLFFVFAKGETRKRRRIQDKGVARIIKRWATLAIPNDHLVLTHNMAQEGCSHCWLLDCSRVVLLLSTESGCVEKQGSILPMSESQLKARGGRKMSTQQEEWVRPFKRKRTMRCERNDKNVQMVLDSNRLRWSERHVCTLSNKF